MKYIKLLYRIEDDIDMNCLDKCPFGESSMCGSYNCHKCQHCIGSGEMAVWKLGVSKGVDFFQGYVICKKAYKQYTFKMKVMKIIHQIKLKIKQLLKND